VPHFLSPDQAIACVETSTEMLRILHESEEDHFEGVATGDEFWFQFQYSYLSSKMFVRSPTDVIPRMRQGIETKHTMKTISITGRQLIVLDILPKGNKFDHLYFVDYAFRDLKKENAKFHRRIPHATFWHIWTIQCTTMHQKYHQNSRSIMFHDYLTHPIHQTEAPATLVLWNVEGVLKDRDFTGAMQLKR
jgi:hypothetical protein